MKIYNKKGLISGAIEFMIAIMALVTVFIKGLSVKMAFLLPVLFSITQITRSLSKAATKEDLIAAADERDQYIILKTSQKSLQVLNIMNYIIIIASMIIYSVTNVLFWLGCFILSSVYFTVLFITELVANHYYEKHA